MTDRFFVLMYATSGNEHDVTKFQSFHDLDSAVDMVQDWLEKRCALDCYPASQEAQLREENGGELPESAFLCPEITAPQDLTKYNGFYNYLDAANIFNLFLTPVYDKQTAVRFKNMMNNEFEIDHEYSERADKMMAHLDTFVRSFEDPDLDVTEAEEAIRNFLVRGGFSLWEGADEEAYPESVVMPSNARNQFDPSFDLDLGSGFGGGMGGGFDSPGGMGGYGGRKKYDWDL
jgi:hypothetical protein